MYQFRPISDRVARLRKRYRDNKFTIDAERALIVTDFIRENLYMPAPLKRANTLYQVCAKMTLRVEDDELIVGNISAHFRGCTISPEYGGLRWLKEELESGARIDTDPNKRHPMDFALWKAQKPGEPAWDTPWGSKGRPGWHIECSAMVNKYLGPTIDIHSGGLDLIFPHHENEIAQSECANGCEFAHYWLHNGFLTIDNEKMSKSKGNFFMVRDAAKQFGYETIRMFMLSAHYRTPLNYSAESLEMNKVSLARLYEARNNMEFRIGKAEGDSMTAEEAVKMEALQGYKQKFIDAMDDDLNTADALSAIFELTREINAYMGAHQDATKAFLTAAHDLFMELTGVLNLVQQRDDAVDPDAEKIEALIAQRAAAKKEKNFAEADRIRDELAAMGVTIKDTRQGTQWSRA